MSSIFPEPIQRLPRVNFPIDSVLGFLSQSDDHQIVFMEFTQDTDIPEHLHKSQWEVILQGKVDLFIEGIKRTYVQGETFFIKAGQKHSAHVYKGYASIAYFNQKDRYSTKSFSALDKQKTESQ
jgi:quercetin dioxygenase-like cupin family protein